MTTIIERAAAAVPSRVRVTADSWSADLALLTALLAAILVFGRPFTKLGAGSVHLYVTELALALILAFALLRVGWAGALARIRRAVPVIPLGVFWLAGAFATVRGLHAYGLGDLTHDVGLVEYSIVVPVIALVVDSGRRAQLFLRALTLASVAAGIFYFAVYTVSEGGPFGISRNPGSAVAMYVALFALFVAARYVLRLGVGRLEIAAAAVCLTVLTLPVVKSALLALAASALALVLLAARGRRLRAAVAGAVCLAVAVAGGLAVESLGLGPIGPPKSEAAPQPAEKKPPALPIAGDIGDTLSPDSSGSRANAQWRLAIWRHLLGESVRHPIFGVGFGHPIAFHWRGHVYDARRGDPNNPVDVVGPHNSFINILYRTGALGAIALLALLVIAAWRAVRLLRALDTSVERRLALLTLSVAFVFALVIAGFNVALEGPYMGVYFWTLLGLLLVTSATRSGSNDAPVGPPARRRG